MQQRGGIEYIAAGMPGQLPIGFHYHPLVLILAVLLSVLTVLFSAWLPAGKLSRMTPLEAIRGTGVTGLRRKRHSPILSIFIWYRGGTGRKCAEGAKESAAHFHIVSDLVIYGVYNDAVFFFSYRSQHQIHLFSALSGCLGYYDNNKRYQN